MSNFTHNDLPQSSGWPKEFSEESVTAALAALDGEPTDEITRLTSSFCIDRAIEAVQNAVHSAEYNHCAIDRAKLWAEISQAWTAIATSGKL